LAIQPIAAWMNGEFKESFAWTLDASPCAKALGDKVYFCSTGVQQRFPKNQTLVELEADSYFGICLLDTNQNPIGVLCVMDNKPMERAALTESLLSIFATRAAASLNAKEPKRIGSSSRRKFNTCRSWRASAY